MGRFPVSEESVELAIMVEAGLSVRYMGVMTKEKREQACYPECMSLISKIPGEHFKEDGVCEQMQRRFKGTRKGGGMNPANLHRKYEVEIILLKMFAFKFPLGNWSMLPSGTS